MLKYSVLNNMLRRMKKYAEVFSKISACFRENLYKKLKNIEMFLGRFLVSYSLIAPYM